MRTPDPLDRPQSDKNDVPFLKLRLTAQTTVLLPMSSVQEALTVSPKRLTLVPNMPDCVLGLLNQRSHLYWTIDLPQLLGISGMDLKSRQYHLAILNNQFSSFGLAVQCVEGVVRAPIDDLQSPDFSLQFSDYVQGHLPAGQSTLPVLNPNAIVNDSRLCPQSLSA